MARPEANQPAQEPAIPHADDDTTIEVGITDADHAQLMWFSKMQGLDVDPSETKNQTFSRLKQAYEHSTIRVPKNIEDEQSKPVRSDVLSTGAMHGLPEKVTIMIHHSGEDSEDEYQPVAHNGVVYRVRKGINVEVPWFVYKILEDAVEIRYEVGRDSGLGPERRVSAVSFNRVK